MEEELSLRERKKMYLRKKILDSAAHEFKVRGFVNTSVSNIMQEAALGVGTFYNYFDSKQEVLRDLVKELFTQVEEKIHATEKKNSSSLELLKIACEYTAELIDENRFVLPLLASAAEHSDKPEQKQKNLSPGFKKIFDEIILRGQECGEIRKDIPADLIAEMFHSIYQAAAFSKLEFPFKKNICLKVKILLDGLKV